MNITSFDQLFAGARSLTEKSRIAVVAAQDEHTLESVVQAARDGLVLPQLIGDLPRIKEMLAGYGANPADFELIQADDVEACLKIAVDLVNTGKSEVIMKGRLETGQLMKAIVNKENNLNRGRKISVFGFFPCPLTTRFWP